MKGFKKHIAASIAITAVFVVCALTLSVAAVPVSSPDENSGGTQVHSVASLVPDEIITAAGEASAALTAVEEEAAVEAPQAADPVPVTAPAPDVPEDNPGKDNADVETAKPPSVEPSPVLIINPPKDLAGTFIPEKEPYIQLTWDPNNNKKVYSYFLVYRKLADDDVVQDGPTKPIAKTKKAEYEDYEIKPGCTYRYWVTAVSRTGEESEPSKAIEVETYAPVPPVAPANVTAVAIDPGVSIDWDASSERGLAGYNVYEPQGSSGKWSKINDEPLVDNHYYDVEGLAGSVYAVACVNFYGVESEYVKVEAAQSVAVVYEENDPSITVEGLWVEETYEGPTNGKIRVAEDTGSNLYFTFKGNQVKMIVANYWTCGSANVYIDGVFVDTINQYSADPIYQVVDVNVPGLKSGKHVLTVEVLGSGNPEGDYNFVNIDAFEVR
ncbi:MAG: fibronectin type III domain-containing protein [Actinomycetota bacterium]|nr:fibronectin type III domain-containing protein [Actinomycetota bacterium]